MIKPGEIKIVFMISPNQLTEVVSSYSEDLNFDYRAWSIYQAKQLESLARLIRKGYKEFEGIE